jgi:hypothetical protein
MPDCFKILLLRLFLLLLLILFHLLILFLRIEHNVIDIAEQVLLL